MRIFHLYLIKPSHYGQDGYPIRWWRTYVPSNTLASLNGLALDCMRRKVLGDDVEMRITQIDETNTRLPVRQLIKQFKKDGDLGLVALVGVQSNQFPRAVDIAKPFLEQDIPVCLGGFHVSGCMAMLPEMPPEMVEAQNMGISFFYGEAENKRLDLVLRDALSRTLKSEYDFRNDLPDLMDEPVPFLPVEITRRAIGGTSSFDVGRGCPFECSFCTIINVQGRKSRFRTGADIERLVRENIAIGCDMFFITDDNFARNKNWEEIFDVLIKLRRDEGISLTLTIQVDTACHKIKGFIDKASLAGVRTVFIGLENINPDNLIAAKKRQNKITDYRAMMLAWKQHPVFLVAGYIIGLPNDTYESVLRDVEIIKRELPVDLLNLNYLTPLPGSEDHQKMSAAGEWMDPDLNKYDLCHRVAHHAVMSDAEWDRTYDDAWAAYYNYDHMVTVLKRMFGTGSNLKFYTTIRLAWACTFATGRFKDVRLEGAFLPMRRRDERSPHLPKEGLVRFWSRYVVDLVSFGVVFGTWWTRLRYQLYKIAKDPKRSKYRDQALTPVQDDDVETLDLFTQTSGGADAVKRAKTLSKIKISISSERGKADTEAAS